MAKRKEQKETMINKTLHKLKIKQEEFEDTKVVIRIRKSKKDRQRNGQKLRIPKW
jgi:hypothetical protein